MKDSVLRHYIFKKFNCCFLSTNMATDSLINYKMCADAFASVFNENNVSRSFRRTDTTTMKLCVSRVHYHHSPVHGGWRGRLWVGYFIIFKRYDDEQTD